jgi:4-amino-4-deoxy-L-arabinose transferase-like glycosyltransferase
MAKAQLLFLSLLLCIFARGMTLEYPDLSDPTEARYAFIAQEMMLSGDWVVPKLPWQGEMEPYLGKPPFHFWLTAASFSLFGMDEWAARLPSFLSLLIMCTALLSLRRFPELRDSAVTASLILASSALMFFMAGASVVDVTLSGFTTIAFTAAYVWISDAKGRYLSGIFFAIGLGIAFLTKGPIALVIVGLPALIWLLVTKRYSLLSRPPWLLCIAMFLLITVPWFLAAQGRNPDFLRYFFVNENFGRYLLKDYGDRYGSGHHYPYGMIWAMAMAGFLPWTPVLAAVLWQLRRKVIRLTFWRERPALLFFALWALSPLLIFTFAEQLHPGYILPGIPGLAVSTALLLRETTFPSIRPLYGVLAWVLVIAAPIVGIGGIYLGATHIHILLSVSPLLGVVWVVYRLIQGRIDEALLSVAAATAYASSIFLLADNISERGSAESILRCISHYAPEAEPTVGVINSNSYSLYFYSRAWRGDLEKPIQVQYLNTEHLPEHLPHDILMRTKDRREISDSLSSSYHQASSRGRWTWMRRSEDPTPLECPDER